MSAVVDAVHQHSGIVGKSERAVQIIVIAALIYQRRTLVVIVRAGEVQLVGREHFQFHTVGDIAEIADVLFSEFNLLKLADPFGLGVIHKRVYARHPAAEVVLRFALEEACAINLAVGIAHNFHILQLRQHLIASEAALPLAVQDRELQAGLIAILETLETTDNDIAAVAYKIVVDNVHLEFHTPQLVQTSVIHIDEPFCLAIIDYGQNDAQPFLRLRRGDECVMLAVLAACKRSQFNGLAFTGQRSWIVTDFQHPVF